MRDWEMQEINAGGRSTAHIRDDLLKQPPNWGGHDLALEAAERLELLTELLTLAEANRDEARAKVDGGKWQWGVRTTWDDGTTTDGWYRDETAAYRVAAPSPDRNQVVRRRVGPVEQVTDDGSGT